MSHMLSTESTSAFPFLERVSRDRPGWADEKLQAWDAMAFRQAENFIIRHYWTKQGSINVFRITGTDHPQYAGMSWAELLDRRKRMDINIPSQENPLVNLMRACAGKKRRWPLLDTLLRR